MEFTEDDGPAEAILDIENHYTTGYVALVTTDQKVTGPTKPGHATLTFANKKDLFQKPGVSLPDLKKAPLVSSKMTDGEEVERITDARIRRQAYEVSMSAKLRRGVVTTGEKGIVTYRPPEEFDTATIKSKYPDSGGNWLDTDTANQRFAELFIEWAKKSLIWVCTNEKGRIGPTFYSHVGIPHKFHHSSFTSGGALIAAGEWIVEAGSLKRISANSGHYQPTINEFHRAVLYMSPAWNTDTEVLVFNKTTDNWEYVPVNVFKGDPSGGGKYFAHPDQVK